MTNNRKTATIGLFTLAQDLHRAMGNLIPAELLPSNHTQRQDDQPGAPGTAVAHACTCPHCACPCSAPQGAPAWTPTTEPHPLAATHMALNTGAATGHTLCGLPIAPAPKSDREAALAALPAHHPYKQAPQVTCPTCSAWAATIGQDWQGSTRGGVLYATVKGEALYEGAPPPRHAVGAPGYQRRIPQRVKHQPPDTPGC